MKRFTSYMPRVGKRALQVVAGLTATVAVTAIALAAWGPDRPTKVYSPGVRGFEYVTFNSFTNVPRFGDEREFFHGQYADQAQSFYDPLSQLRQGDEVTLHVYMHNGADASLNASGQGIARNTNVRVALPQGMKTASQGTAFISADNAQPRTVFDTMDFKAENGKFFELDYVEGSARLVGNNVDRQISDSIVTTGVNIGDVRGCFEDAVAVTIKVKVNMPRYSVGKTVRHEGQGPNDWKESIDTKAGDVVEWRVGFFNSGATQLNDVKIVDQVPNHMTVVPGSVRLVNSNFPSPGYTYPANAVQSNGRQINVDIDDYAPQGGGYVYFKTRVNNAEELKCGNHTLINTVYATPSGFGEVHDTAQVVVKGQQNCVQPVNRCEVLTASAIDRDSFRFDARAVAQGGARVKSYVFQFGDGTSQTVNTTETSASVSKDYAQPGTYNTRVTVTFTVNGRDVTSTSDACAKQVVVTPPGVTPPPVPPTELPNTGAGEVIGMFFGTGILAAAVRSWLNSRRSLKATLTA